MKEGQWYRRRRLGGREGTPQINTKIGMLHEFACHPCAEANCLFLPYNKPRIDPEMLNVRLSHWFGSHPMLPMCEDYTMNERLFFCLLFSGRHPPSFGHHAVNNWKEKKITTSIEMVL